MNNTYELWEIFKDGKNDEVYEVVSCSLPAYLGHKVKVQSKTEEYKSFKCLVNPDVEGEGEEALAVLYGCLGTAKFKKLVSYEEVTYTEALDRLADYRTVYYKELGQYVELSRYTNLVDLYITDISDLFNTKFYVKAGN